MKYIVIILLFLFPTLAFSQSDNPAENPTKSYIRIERDGQSYHLAPGASGTFLKSLGDTLVFDTVSGGGGGITGSGAANQVAYWTGASAVTGSNAFGFNGSKLRLNRGGVFTDLATVSFQKAAADTYIQYWRNSTDVVSTIDSLGWLYFRTGGNDVGIGGMDGSGNRKVGSGSTGIGVVAMGAGQFGGAEFWFKLNSNYTRTAGDSYGFRIERTFAPTSGTSTFGAVTQRDVINQTGGASGITWGFWASPTLTSAADYRAFRYDLNTGTGLYFAGTAPNYLGGTLGVGGVTRGTSENWFSATDTYIQPTDSLKLSGTIVIIDGAIRITGSNATENLAYFTGTYTDDYRLGVNDTFLMNANNGVAILRTTSNIFEIEDDSTMIDQEVYLRDYGTGSSITGTAVHDIQATADGKLVPVTITDTVYITIAPLGLADSLKTVANLANDSWAVPSELNGYKIAKIQYAVFQAGAGTGSTVVGLRRYSSTRSVGYSNGYSADFAAGDLNEAITGSSTLLTGDLYVFHVNAHTMTTAATGLTATLMLTK